MPPDSPSQVLLLACGCIPEIPRSCFGSVLPWYLLWKAASFFVSPAPTISLCKGHGYRGITGGEPESFGLKISPAPGVQPNLYDVLALLNPKLHFNYYHLTKPIICYFLGVPSPEMPTQPWIKEMVLEMLDPGWI